jgi:hypothetical protein
MTPPEQQEPYASRTEASGTPAKENVLNGLASPGRHTRESTKQLMSTPLYRSWLSFIRSAKQQDGSDFSETSRTNLRSLGTGLLSSLLEKYPPASDCAEIDTHFRTIFSLLNRAESESLIARTAGTAVQKKPQLRSVLINLIGPWAESQGIALSEGFPRPAAPHPVEARLDDIPSFKRLCAELDRLVDRGTLTTTPAASVKRKAVLFLQFAYDQWSPQEWSADAFQRQLTESFDRLLRAYLQSGSVSAASLNTVRSALNRHFRPQVTGAPVPADFATTRRAEATRRMHQREDPEAPQVSGTIPAPDRIRPQAAVPELDRERYQHALEAALTALGGATKLSRRQLAGLLSNDVRLSSPLQPCLVRVFMPEVSPRIPRPWLSISEQPVHEALDVYQKQRRLVPTARHCKFFFVDLNGEPLKTAPPKGSSKKHRC